jgi:uncharacterized protein YneF (UPF0154 family)
MSRFDVCYVISHGFAARMVLQTDLIPRIKETGLEKIAIILPGSYDKAFIPYEKELGIKIFFADFKYTFWSNDYMFFRKYIYEDFEKNPALKEKHIRSIKEQKGINPWKKMRPHIYYKLNKAARGGKAVKSLFRRYESRMLNNKKLEALLEEVNPAMLAATYPVNYIEASLLFLARKKNIKTVIQLLSWDNITCKGYFPETSDYFISWGKIMSDEIKEYYGYPDDRIFETGVAHFDSHITLPAKEKISGYLKEAGLDPGKPYIFFGMSSPYFSPYEIDIVERLAGEVTEGIYGDIQLVIRPHPQNVQGEMSDLNWLPRLEKLKNERVAVDYPGIEKSHIPWTVQKNDLDRLVNLIYGCSILINSGSTITIEGLIHNKPVILTMFDAGNKLPWHLSALRLTEYYHLKKITDTKAAAVVNSFDELTSEIKAYLTDPSRNEEARKKVTFLECGVMDGKAVSRIAEALHKITNLN